MPIDLTARRHQRPAGVARIERRVGLDDVVDEPAGLRPQRSPERADHARRHRVLEADTGCRSRSRPGRPAPARESPNRAHGSVRRQRAGPPGRCRASCPITSARSDAAVREDHVDRAPRRGRRGDLSAPEPSGVKMTPEPAPASPRWTLTTAGRRLRRLRMTALRVGVEQLIVFKGFRIHHVLTCRTITCRLRVHRGRAGDPRVDR